MTKNKNIHYQDWLNKFILAGYSFLPFGLFFYQKILPPILIFIGLNLLIYPHLKERFYAIRFKKMMVFSSIFYILHIISVFYSENISHALFDLEVKSSFLLVPVLFSLTPTTLWSKLHIFFKSYVLVGFVMILYTALYILIFSQESINRYLFTSDISLFVHVGYMAIYLNVAIALLFCGWMKWVDIGIKNNYLQVLFIILFAMMIILSGSKNGLITLITIVLMCSFFYARQLNRIKFFYMFILLLVLGFSSVYVSYPNTFKRFNDMVREAKNPIGDRTTKSSTNIRKIAWEASIETIQLSPLFGHGNGDVKDLLMKYYAENEYSSAYERKINAHNQFLQTAIAIGIAGVLSLVSVFYILFQIAIQQKSKLLFLFTFIIFMASLTESVFEVQAGVVFFMVFSSILLLVIQQKATALLQNVSDSEN
jgi:O-antigen ligase